VIPVDQSILHDPDNGHYGDCQRACIASLLEVSIKEIPHFFESGDDEQFEKSFNDFLAAIDLFHLEITPWEKFPISTSVYHMIYGKSERGTQHAVIGLNGKVVHDPSPFKTGLLESDRENWTYAFLIPTYEWSK